MAWRQSRAGRWTAPAPAGWWSPVLMTARAVCDALGIARIELVGEIEPGVPLGRTADGQLDVVARAGTFGDRLSLVRALAAFGRRAS